MLAAVNTEALWYLTRGTGVVSIVLLTITTVLGILQVQRWQSDGWPRFVVAAVHKNASLLVVAFLAVHIASAIIDGFAPIRWLDAIVPFRSAYRPLWLGLGALALRSVDRAGDHEPAAPTARLHRMAGRALDRIRVLADSFVHGLGTGTDTRSAGCCWSTARV